MAAHAQFSQSSKKRTANKPSSRAPRTTVLHIVADLEPGDPARETVDLAVQTQRAGWRALIASSGGLLVTEAERAAVRHTGMPLDQSSMLASWGNRMRLGALIQKERPALLHAHGINAAAQAGAVARAQRLPLVVDFTQPLPHRPRTRRILKRLGKLPCIVRVSSDYMARQLRDTFHWPADRLRLIPPGIDLQLYHPGSIAPERLQELSRLWRIPEHAAVILMPMPFTEGGGHELLLKALVPLKRDDIFAVLIGNNRPASGVHTEIDALVDDHGLNGKVIMPDYCLDWPAACWLANVVVVPNTAPRGQVPELLAAQAIGRPVIVSDCGANCELVQSGETAWVIPPRNISALSRALTEAAGLNTNQRLDLARRTRDFIAGNFPQTKWFNAMMDIYESLMSPAGRRRKAAAA